METLCYKLNTVLPILYGLTATAYLLLFTSNGKHLNRTSRILLILTAAVHLAYLIIRGIGEGHIPLSTQNEAISFFALATLLVYVYLEFRLESRVIGVFILIIILGFQLLASLRYSPFAPINPILQSTWFAFHAASTILSFAAFATAALLSILYLILLSEISRHDPGYVFQRIPPLETLDDMAYKSVKLGFVLLTLGIGTGVIWADRAWGSFWSWDPKQVSSLVVWLVYAAYLHARLQQGWQGKRVAIFATLGFASLIFTFIFVDVLFNTVHKFL
jgi:cytochrome c-type biogenesis protein CcsB